MRRLLLSTLAATALVLLCGGCMKARVHVTLNRDGSADVACTLNAKRAALDYANYVSGMAAGRSIETRKALLAADGFAVTDTSGPDTVGFRATQHAADLGALARMLGSKGIAGEDAGAQGSFGALGQAVRVERGRLVTRYVLNATIDRSTPTKGGSAPIGLAFALTLPMPPGSHNAARVSDGGRTLEWDIEDGKVNRLQAEMTVPNTPVVVGLGVGVALLLGGLATLAIMLRRRRMARRERACMQPPVGAA
jgi:hypothetical protein